MPLAVAALLCLARPAAAAGAAPWSPASFVAAALKSSPEVAEARRSWEESAAQWRSQVGSAWLPTLSFTGATYPWGHDPNDAYRFNHRWRLNRDDLSLNTTLGLNLFNSFQDWLKVRQARLSEDAAARALDAARQAAALGAVKAFYDLQLKLSLRDVAAENLKAQENQYRLIEDLYHHGMKSLSDRLKSETDWRSSQLRMYAAEAALRRALVAFNLLVDRLPEEPADLAADLAPSTTDLPRVSADDDLAVSRRPEVLKAKDEWSKAGASLEQAVQASLPAVALDAAWNRPDPATFGRPGASLVPSPNYQLALKVSLPLGFNLYSQAQNVLAAKAAKGRSWSAVEAAMRSVRQEVHEAHIALEEAVRGQEVAALKVDIASRNLELVGEQYRQGSADVIYLAQAQLDYLQARVESHQARRDVAVGRAQYRLAIGEPIWK